jgi:hypothetical protein
VAKSSKFGSKQHEQGMRRSRKINEPDHGANQAEDETTSDARRFLALAVNQIDNP